jgi:hypothetical protein
MRPGDNKAWSVERPVLDFGRKPAVWDPRDRLTRAAQRFLAVGTSAGKNPADCGVIDGSVAAARVIDELASAEPLSTGFVAAEVRAVELGAAGLVAAGVRALLAEAYAAGRRAEGLHGSGAFAAGFRRLEAHPDFPAVAVGFGPGTTPAGDDWLAGCLVALDLRAGGPGNAALSLRQGIRDRLYQTTAAGKALLLGALAGAPPEYLVGLAGAAAEWTSDTPGVMAVVERQRGDQALLFGSLRAAFSSCLAHGATSGEDALAGFVYGLETDMGLA